MAISCSTILYRAVLKNSWFDPDDHSRIKADAFFRRRPQEKDGVRYPRDEDGLSLFLAARFTPDECMSQFGRCVGVVSLHAGTLLDLGIILTEDDQDVNKALATNLPFENPGTADEEKIAGAVARTARIVKRTN